MIVKNRTAGILFIKFDFVKNSVIRTLVFTTGQINSITKTAVVFGEFYVV